MAGTRPPILFVPPDAHEFKFVLRRYDLDLGECSLAFPCYANHYESRWIEIDGKGAHTLFVREEVERDRAVRLGAWVDETERWAKVTLADRILAALATKAQTTNSVAFAVGQDQLTVEDELLALQAAKRVVLRGGAVKVWSAVVSAADLGAEDGAGSSPPV